MKTLIKKVIITFILGGLFYFGLAICCFLEIWPNKIIVIGGTCMFFGLLIVNLLIYGIESKRNS